MTKRKSKKSNNKIRKNDKKSNEIYNYICMGVIIIIIIFFICKEQVNTKEGFAVTTDNAKQKIEDEIQTYSNIYSKIKANRDKIVEEKSMDTEQKYFTFYSRFRDIEENFEILKSLGEHIVKLITTYNTANNPSNILPLPLVKSKIKEVEDKVDTMIANIKKIEDDNITNNKKFVVASSSADSDSVIFHLNVPAKMHLKENPSIFYVYLKVDDKKDGKIIYGPIILISYNQYKLLDINTKAINFSEDNPIKIKIEDIANELFKKKDETDVNNEIIDAVITGKSNIYLYGIDQNDTSIIFNNKKKYRKRDHEYLEERIDNHLTNKKNTYIDILSKENAYYMEKLSTLQLDFFNKLDRFGIEYNNSTFSDEFRNHKNYGDLETYYTTKLVTDTLNTNNIKELQTQMDILEDNRILCDKMFETQTSNLDKLFKKHQNIETAITKNKFSIGDEKIRRVLGNNTEYYQDGIIDIGAVLTNVS
jgi:hypothetical protein